MHHTLRCPCCHGTLSPGPADEAAGGAATLVAACGRRFVVRDGVPDLVFPQGQAYLEENAGTYDRDIRFIADLLQVEEAEARRSVVEKLGLSPGAVVLEVACGPGSNLPYLTGAASRPAEVWALDISPAMIRAAAARPRPTDVPVEFVLANGCHLPFADGTFDAVLHLGTLNRFDDVRGALAEMARVTKVGGRVVAGDEGLAPWLQAEPYGQVLARFGALFKGTPPLHALPSTAEDVTLGWLMGYAYFAISFRVGPAAPTLNLDVTLPGREVTVRQVLDAVARRQADDERES